MRTRKRGIILMLVLALLLMASGVHGEETVDHPIVGKWMVGWLSDGEFNAATGKPEGGVSGFGGVYTFRPDGTFMALWFWPTVYAAGKYSVVENVLTLFEVTEEESEDGGKTWSVRETLPEASLPIAFEADDTGEYLLICEQGATPPFVHGKNAMKYQRQK